MMKLNDNSVEAPMGRRDGRVLHILDSLRFASGLNSVVLKLARHVNEERFDFMVFEELEASLRQALTISSALLMFVIIAPRAGTLSDSRP